MTELKTYRCDRCQKQFSKPIGEEPSKVTRDDNTYIPDEEPQVFQLCDDCIVQFWKWDIHSEDFDKFADSMATKWEKEAEKENRA